MDSTEQNSGSFLPEEAYAAPARERCDYVLPQAVTMDEAAFKRYEALVAEFGNQAEDDDRCEMLDQAMKDADDAYAQSEKTPKDRKLLATKLKLLFVARQHAGCGRPQILNE